MRLIVNIIALLGVIIAVFTTGTIYIQAAKGGFDGAGGMAIIFFQLWAVIGSLVAMLFGFVGRLMDRRVPIPASRFSNSCIVAGLLGGLLLFAAPLVFG